jgi:hypothetical protein
MANGGSLILHAEIDIAKLTALKSQKHTVFTVLRHRVHVLPARVVDESRRSARIVRAVVEEEE